MLQAQLINDEIVTMGEVREGDVYPGLCCAGHNFTVALVLESAWGHCDNPEHYHDGEDPDPYQGVNSFSIEDIALKLVDGGEAGQ